MNDLSERRNRADRRQFAQYSHSGPERRNKTKIDRREAVDERVKEIAATFGLRTGSIELLADDDLLEKPDHCHSCEELARRCAELDAELAERRKEIEQYRKQLEALRPHSPHVTLQ